MSENCVILNADNFDECLKDNEVVVVDFWASWCGPCKMLAPVIDEIADDFKGKAVIGKVNVDDESALAERFGIMSIPSVFIFKNGEVKEKLIGYRQKTQIAIAISKNL